MELKINIDFQDIVSAVRQLSVSELENLAISITTELTKKKKYDTQNWKNILLKAPDWSEADYENFIKVRDHFNKSRLRNELKITYTR